ncbi:MAG: EamA family transporter RarD [bacterium]|nr:EamA family transporter RarD [bacterium]MCP5067996.1 EamA family transporter RarD [bacterium]
MTGRGESPCGTSQVREARSRAEFSLGIVYALLAYGVWGVLPVYWKALAAVPATEILAWRVVGTLAFTLLLLGVLGRIPELTALRRQPRDALRLGLGGALIGTNWLIFIWAVNHELLLEASFGYYLNPLFNVFLGRVVLGERIWPLQASAVAIAAGGVAVLGWHFGGLPWISLALATSFGLYGLIHKLSHARPIPALSFETTLLAPLAVLFLIGGVEPAGGAIARGLSSEEQVLLLAAGPVTALPLLWFGSAARRLPLSLLGLFQYIAPSMGFLLALFVYDEPFSPAHGVAFSFIWLALALFSFDSWRRSR